MTGTTIAAAIATVTAKPVPALAERLHFAAVERGDGNAAGGPDKPDDGGGDIRRARRAVTQGLQNLSDTGAIIIGGAARRCIARRPPGGRCVLLEKIGGRCRRRRIGGISLGGGAVRRAGARVGCANTERLLDGGERLFRCVFCFLWSIRHFGRRLVITPDCRRGPNRHDSEGEACHEPGTPSRPPRCKHPRSIARQSSYRLGNAKETTAVKDFFIIVNRLRTIANAVHRPLRKSDRGCRIGAAERPNA